MEKIEVIYDQFKAAIDNSNIEPDINNWQTFEIMQI